MNLFKDLTFIKHVILLVIDMIENAEPKSLQIRLLRALFRAKYLNQLCLAWEDVSACEKYSKEFYDKSMVKVHKYTSYKKTDIERDIQI